MRSWLGPICAIWAAALCLPLGCLNPIPDDFPQVLADEPQAPLVTGNPSPGAPAPRDPGEGFADLAEPPLVEGPSDAEEADAGAPDGGATPLNLRLKAGSDAGTQPR